MVLSSNLLCCLADAVTLVNKGILQKPLDAGEVVVKTALIGAYVLTTMLILTERIPCAMDILKSRNLPPVMYSVHDGYGVTKKVGIFVWV